MRLSLRLPSVYPKVKRKMDPIFEHLAFDSDKEKLESVIIQLEKPQEALENSLYTCFQCGRNKIFSIAKHVRPANEGTTILNECRDCHKKWRE